MPEETPQKSNNEDIQKLINEALDEKLQALQQTMIQSMNETVTGLGTRIKKENQRLISEEVSDKIESTLAPMQEFLKGQTSSESQPKPEAKTENEGQSSSNQFQEFSEQLKAIQRQNQTLKEALELEKANRQQAEYESKEALAASKFVSSLQQKVNDPNAFLVLLKAQENVVFDPETKQYIQITQDQWGENVSTPILSKVDDLLNTEKYSYMKPRRPGGGLGNQASNAAPPTPQHSKYFGEGKNKSGSELFDIAKKEGGMEAIVDELLKSAKE